MKTARSSTFWSIGAVVALSLLVTGGAYGQQTPPQGETLVAQGGSECYAIGQEVAAREGGTLAGAQAEAKDGGTVCRIVVLVPARDGERPRRAEFVVPAQ